MAPNLNPQAPTNSRSLGLAGTLLRELVHSGEFAGLIRDLGVTGATSSPTIFAKAITGSDRYGTQRGRDGFISF